MEAIQTWIMAIEQPDQWLISVHTAPDIRQEIIDGLQTWQKGKTTQTTPMTSEAADKQNKLGWDLAMEGCLLKRWQSQQEAYWKAFHMQWLSRWTSELIKNF